MLRRYREIDNTAALLFTVEQTLEKIIIESIRMIRKIIGENERVKIIPMSC